MSKPLQTYGRPLSPGGTYMFRRFLLPVLLSNLLACSYVHGQEKKAVDVRELTLSARNMGTHFVRLLPGLAKDEFLAAWREYEDYTPGKYKWHLAIAPYQADKNRFAAPSKAFPIDWSKPHDLIILGEP